MPGWRCKKTDSQKPDLEREPWSGNSVTQRRSKNIMDAIETGSANPQLIARLDDLTQQESTLTFQLSTMEREQRSKCPQTGQFGCHPL